MDATLRNMEKIRGAVPQSPAASKTKRKKNRLKNLDKLTKLEMAKRAALEEDKDDDDFDDEEAEEEILELKKKELLRKKKQQQQQQKLQQQLQQHKRDDPLKVIPDEYRKHGVDTEPILHYLRLQSDDEPLAVLLDAAQQDIRLHQARIKAANYNDIAMLASYDYTQDPQWIERQEHKKERLANVGALQQGAKEILQDLEKETVKKKKKNKENMTTTEQTQVKLARWQRALELYVYAPTEMNMDLLELLEKLLDGTREEEELSEVLNQASQMCTALVDATQGAVRDATEDAAEAEDAYVIRLEAHAMYAQNALRKSEEIQSQFRTNGRAALQIGHQLEFAESKRAQCESASILIRRWWMMEQLAESEHVTKETLKVNEEVRGVIPPASCRMDPLFTLPEHSLEASKALKQLRAVVRSRGNAATAAATATGGWSDPNSQRRFDLTANLIARTSDALESRLLNSFSAIYSEGGIYDFSETPRVGHIDWRQLRKLAQALLMFDSGRNLHKRYVEMVITSRFPELFQPKTVDPEDEDDMEFNMDATRSELSSLFHRVSDVCTAEFELIAHVFGDEGGTEEMTLTVARALLQRVISDPKNGLQSRISDLLESIDRRGDFDAGSKKLDTFVVIHEKAAGLFHLLREAAEKMLAKEDDDDHQFALTSESLQEPTVNAATALKQFLTSQEIALSSGHRKGYLNLELRLLHHECCSTLDAIGCVLDMQQKAYTDLTMADRGILEEYHAPILPIDSKYLLVCDLLSGPLKESVRRQPLSKATDSIARARLMFGTGKKGGETTGRVIAAIYNQMCNFYGQAYLYPIVESLISRLARNAPNGPPQLPFPEKGDSEPHDLGVPAKFWVNLESIDNAARSFDRDLWAENRPGSARVWETLLSTGSTASMAFARKCRLQFFAELETRCETVIVAALDTLTTHIKWILVTGGEATQGGPNRFFSGQSGGGPYCVHSSQSFDNPNSPAVQALCYCLRTQFVNIQAALITQTLSAFWTALSKRLYDVFVPRLLQHYRVTTDGAVLLSRDVEALRSVAMLAGTDHTHWDNLRELVTLYMTPPKALRTMLVGPEGDANSAKGLFKRVGRYTSLVFMSRRADYRVKNSQQKSTWVVDLLDELGVQDPADGDIKMGYFAAEQKNAIFY